MAPRPAQSASAESRVLRSWARGRGHHQRSRALNRGGSRQRSTRTPLRPSAAAPLESRRNGLCFKHRGCGNEP
eukprot:gene16199-biopygen20256